MAIKFNADNLFFTSDLHFHHRTMLNWRPFESVEEMNDQLIHNWNSFVGPNDHVFLLGDVSFGGVEKTIAAVSQLNGFIHLIRGNHDRNIKGRLELLFATIHDYLEIDVLNGDEKQRVVLSHFPFRSWNRHHYGSYHLHGHCHGNIEELGKSMDVGVDANDFLPVPYHFIDGLMQTRQIHEIDHHTKKDVEKKEVA